MHIIITYHLHTKSTFHTLSYHQLIFTIFFVCTPPNNFLFRGFMETERGFTESGQALSNDESIGLDLTQLNKITKPFQNERSILMPLYVRACLRQLVSVSVDDESVIGKFDFYITFPYKLDASVRDCLGIGKKQAEDFQIFLQNNITLEIGGSYIDIAIDISPNIIKRQPLPDEQAISALIDHSIRQQNIEKDNELEEQLQRQAQESMKPYFYTRRHDNKTCQYATYLVSGQFKCQGDLISQLFPYHQLRLAPTMRAIKLFYKDIGIIYNFMCLQKDCRTKQFVFGPQLPDLGRFGIYQLNMTFRKMEGAEEQVDRQERNYQRGGGSMVGLHVTQAISFIFKVHSFNVPFIIRNQIPLWVLCLASFALNFALVSQVANIYGNIILISVAQISLLSNFRQGSYKTQFGGLYELTLSGFIIISLLQIVIQTKLFYNRQGQQDMKYKNISSDRWFFQSSYVIALVLLFINVTCMIIIGCIRKSQRRNKKEMLTDFKSLQWNEDDFLNCIPFKQKQDEQCSNVFKIFDY